MFAFIFLNEAFCIIYIYIIVYNDTEIIQITNRVIFLIFVVSSNKEYNMYYYDIVIRNKT